MDESSVETSLIMMGINPSSHPRSSNPPSILSAWALKAWKTIFSDNTVNPIFRNLPNTFSEWVMAFHLLEQMRQMSKDPTATLIDTDLTDLEAEGIVRREILSKRALAVSYLNRAQVLTGIKLVQLEKTVNSDGNTVTLLSTAKVNFNHKQSDAIDWLNSLIRQRHFIKTASGTGHDYFIPGAPNGVDIRFNVNLPRVSFIMKTLINAKYIPLKCLTPLLDCDIFEDYYLKKLWLPAIREFRIQNLQRKLQLI